MAASFRIGDRLVGDDAPVLVVAELSANHAGRRDAALRTIEAAAKAGADAIKLQTYTPDTLTLKSGAPHFVVKTKNEWAGRTLHDLYAEAMTPWEWHAELRDAAKAAGLLFFSTPFDCTAVEFLENLGVAVHKVASFELVDLPLVDHVARRGKPMIMSTGMASLGEIEAAVRVCREAGNDQLALLRCVSAYPAKPEAMALSSLATLASFGTVVGLSDHTRESTVAVAAIALGAKIVEKHFIVDRSLGGPDAFFSLEPDEFAGLVKAVRATEAAMGKPRFGPSPDEVASTAFRRSLFVARDVAEGAVLTCDDVRSVRPSHGLHTRHLPEVLGRPAARALLAGTPLDWSAVAPETPRPTITLRPATTDDAPNLLAWRNDPVTRAMSRSQDVVAANEHEKWLGARLRVDSPSRLFVAVRGTEAVGQIRLDMGGGGSAEISITVAPSHRARGEAVAMLTAAEDIARELSVNALVAQIRRTNAASVTAFKRAGYYAFVERDLDGAGYWACERRVRPFA
jgi:pseudaminic acid synthase